MLSGGLWETWDTGVRDAREGSYSFSASVTLGEASTCMGDFSLCV